MIHIWKYGQISSEISETKIQNDIYLNIWNGAKYILEYLMLVLTYNLPFYNPFNINYNLELEIISFTEYVCWSSRCRRWLPLPEGLHSCPQEILGRAGAGRRWGGGLLAGRRGEGLLAAGQSGAAWGRAGQAGGAELQSRSSVSAWPGRWSSESGSRSRHTWCSRCSAQWRICRGLSDSVMEIRKCREWLSQSLHLVGDNKYRHLGRDEAEGVPGDPRHEEPPLLQLDADKQWERHHDVNRNGHGVNWHYHLQPWNGEIVLLKSPNLLDCAHVAFSGSFPNPCLDLKIEVRQSVAVDDKNWTSHLDCFLQSPRPPPRSPRGHLCMPWLGHQWPEGLKDWAPWCPPRHGNWGCCL